MDINDRIKVLRKALNLTMEKFGEKVGVKKNTISQIESGINGVTDQMFKLIVNEFNVNENWLRTGEGEMFDNSDKFSFDEYAKSKNLTALEISIIKAYMSLDTNMRNDVLNNLKAMFEKESSKTDTNIEAEVESYRKELQAEKKGIISSATEDVEENLA